MKRMLKRTLACLLCMLLALPAMADTVVVPDEKSGYNNIVGSAVVGETVYLHEVNGTRMDILRWQDGMEQADVVFENVPYAPNFNSLAEINAILHQYADIIVGRLGIPYRSRGVSIIALAVDGSMDAISGMTGRLGKLPVVSVKAAISKR